MTDTSLMVTNTRLAIMPVMDNTTAMMRRQAIIDFTRAVMRPDVDYGRVPGTQKDTLLKPGAEKLTSLFGLSPRFDIAEKETDWTGKDHGGEPFFYFQYRCSLYYGDVLAGQGVGSCNSWEKKYRYRNAERVCPDCGKATIFKSKPRPNDPPGKPMGYYCWNKKGGCGAQFGPGDVRIESQEAGQVPNDNPADLVNTVDKMAQKRALVAAVLIAVNASEFFTQDIEDMDFGQEVIDVTPQPGKKITVTTPPANGKPAPGATISDPAWNDLLDSPFTPGVEVMVRGKSDEKPGEVINDEGKSTLQVRVDGKTFWIAREKVTPIPTQPALIDRGAELPLGFDDPATAYAE